jgi:hypothetical protein
VSGSGARCARGLCHYPDVAPSVAEIVDLVVRLEDDSERRHILDGQPHGLFRVAVDEGLVRPDGIDSFAEVVGHAVKQGALGFRAEHGGVVLPSPDALWTDHAFQSRIGYFATITGQQMAALYRERRAGGDLISEPATIQNGAGLGDESPDVFVSHASEDKALVAYPLAEALKVRGWRVWLDALELTLGDSLSGHIDAALARSRFGVVVLSPAFFAKEWPQRELAGLAAREVDAGSKVILPVWHEVDQHYVTRHSPILADRLGALTSEGIDTVADKISLALVRAGMHAVTGFPPASVVQSVEPQQSGRLLSIPATDQGQARLIKERSDWWEHRLFAGVLLKGKAALETKWDDHEIRLPRGERRHIDEASAPGFLGQEVRWMSKQAAVVNRIFSRPLQEQAFGPPGQPGDPVRIEALAQRLITMYEVLLDWAASMRGTAVPDRFEEALEATACFVDAPIAQIREFIDMAVDQIGHLPDLAATGTDEEPAELRLELELSADPAVTARHARAVETLTEELDGG